MKAVKLFLAVILIMTISLGTKAQEKHEYATVIYKTALTKKYIITVSKEGKYEKLDGEVTEDAAKVNLSPAMELLNKMAKEGWELYNSNISFQPVSGITETYYCYTLRKKTN